MFLVEKASGPDRGQLYAMKVQKINDKTDELVVKEKMVHQKIFDVPYTLKLHYSFICRNNLCLVTGEFTLNLY